MGSKLIGFRVADDLAEEIETKAAEGSQSTSEYLRKLIDEDLYPSNGKQPSTQAEAATKEELEELEETVGNIVDENYNLSNQVDKLGKELELSRVTKAMLEENQDEVAKAVALGDKVDEWKGKHNELVAIINQHAEAIKRLPALIEGQADRLYQLLLGYIEVGSLTDEVMEVLRERAKVADERRGELAKVDVVSGKVTAPGYRYLPNIGMSIREKD